LLTRDEIAAALERLGESAALQACRELGGREAIRRAVEPFLVAGDELKATYAFDDLWENIRGDD